MVTRTTTQLLEELLDPANKEAWEGFDRRYRRVLLGIARSLGFCDADAEDLAQRTLAEFARAYRAERYQRGKGRLSSWLLGIARHVGSEMRRRGGGGGPGKGRRVGGDSMLGEVVEEIPNEQHLSQIWSRSREQAILREALEVLRKSPRMEEHTFRAFELFALRGVPAEEVARQCDVEVDSLYVIKNRLTKRLREIVKEIIVAYDDGEGEGEGA